MKTLTLLLLLFLLIIVSIKIIKTSNDIKIMKTLNDIKIIKIIKTLNKLHTLRLNNEDKLDLLRDRHLMSIRQNGKRIGDIEITNNKITTSGIIGNNHYDNFVELIKGLQGFDIKIDDFYW